MRAAMPPAMDVGRPAGRSRMTQHDRVLTHLLDAFPRGVSALELLREDGVYRAGARVYDLRREGWDIVCDEQPGRVGVYRLTHIDRQLRLPL